MRRPSPGARFEPSRDIEEIIGPVAMEAALGSPEAVHEVEAGFPQVIKRDMKPGQRMKRHRSGEKIGSRRPWRGPKSSLGMGLREKPSPYGFGNGYG